MRHVAGEADGLWGPALWGLWGPCGLWGCVAVATLSEGKFLDYRKKALPRHPNLVYRIGYDGALRVREAGSGSARGCGVA